MSKMFKYGTSLSVLGALLVTMPAIAVDTIIVTARKREESIQTVPISVTALTPQMLQEQGVTDFADLSTSVPGLVVVNGPGAARTTPAFSIRGLSQQDLTILSDQSVSVYYGDIVAARAQGLNQSLFDLASVEVLKGPQGTLFGRNSTGGAIVIHPNTPSDSLEGSLGLTIGNLGRQNAEFMVNVPLGDSAAFRVSGLSTKSDGYVHDVILDRMLNDDNSRALRASLNLTPSANLESLFVFNIYSESTNGTGMITYEINDSHGLNHPLARGPRNWTEFGALNTAQDGRGFFDVASGVPAFTKVDTWDLANTTNIELSDNLAIRNIVGYRNVRSHNFTDTDGTPLTLLEIERKNNFEQWSEELQVLGTSGNLEWIAGAYYFQETGSDEGRSNAAAVDPGDLQPADAFAYSGWSNTWSTAENTSYAVFAQGTYDLSSVAEGLSVTAGIRQNWDDRDAVIRNVSAGGCRFTVDDDGDPNTAEVTPTVANCALPLSASFDQPTWTVSAEYQIDSSKLVYLAHRRGYRTGGFGARASTEAGLGRTFLPEIVDDIEFGVKADWDLGGASLRTNLAVFHANYDDIQRLLTDSTTLPVTTVTANAGKATITGAEFEFVFEPTDLVQISGFVSQLDATFDEFIDFSGNDLSGNPFARAPELTYSLTGRFILPVVDASSGELSVGATYYYNDGFSGNDNFDPLQNVDSYELINLRADWRSFMGSDLDLGVFVRNAADEEYSYVGLGLASALAFNSRTPQEPRTYGVELRYHFGE